MKPAIKLSQLQKRFPLYSGQLAQVMGALGLSKVQPSWKVALNDMNLTIARGEKVGVIGRNGSGKTTLLRLVMGHTTPTSGRIDINGSVQGLMQTGFGFHDEMTGLDNVYNSLVYNDVPAKDLDATVADIVDFVELGEFINHPMKTYSLGMRARLEFATATAIKPDILAIDEVLGAGDGYFVSKCAERMRGIISNSTLMLVSHSLDQILEYCDRVIWLDDGRIVEDGPVHLVISAYQNFMAKHNAKVLGSIEDADTAHGNGADTPNARRGPPQAILALRPSPEPQPSLTIVDCRFDGEDPVFRAIETGQPLGLRYTVHSGGTREVRPVLFGATHHGALVFEATAPPLTVTGSTLCRLETEQFNIGVGNYVLVPGLRDADTGEILSISHCGISLRILPTNWSDPPRIHLTGEWRDCLNSAQLRTKISAWV